jgi:hypothetical protein
MKVQKFKIAFVAAAMIGLFISTTNISAQNSLIGASTSSNLDTSNNMVSPNWPGLWFGGFSLRVCVGFIMAAQGGDQWEAMKTTKTNFSKFDVR